MKNSHYTALLVSATMAVAVTAFGRGAQTTQPSTPHQPVKRNYIGASKTSNINEALTNALKDAKRKPPATGPDILFPWHIVEIRGSFGGVGGVNNLEVEIEVQGP